MTRLKARLEESNRLLLPSSLVVVQSCIIRTVGSFIEKGGNGGNGGNNPYTARVFIFP